MKRTTIFVLLLALGVAAWWYFQRKKTESAIPQFRTVAVARGSIVQEVTANGSLSPIKSVEVGSQVSGIIEKIMADFNSQVKEGDVIAQIDPSTYKQNLIRAEAELANAQAALELAQVNNKRAEELFKNKLIAAADYDSSIATFHQAEANVKTREASVYSAKVDLSRTTITAPISGRVISRAVDVGQTVAASFNTPRLFVIANDLTQMQIEAAVSEADVGGVEEGQSVTFSVDAFPNRKFLGKVQQVRFAPITNQNVVTYTAVVGASNPDLKLRPGMTATVRIITAERNNALRVPNAALRFRPPPGATVAAPPNSGATGGTNSSAVLTDESGVPIPPWRAQQRRPNPGEMEQWQASLTPEQREKVQQRMQEMRQRFAEGGGGPGGGMGPGGSGGSPRPRSDGPTTTTVYLLAQPKGSAASPVLRPVTVKTGITDGSTTEVLDGLNEGDMVVTGIASGSSATAESGQQSNPFSPFGGRPRRR